MNITKFDKAPFLRAAERYDSDVAQMPGVQALARDSWARTTGAPMTWGSYVEDAPDWWTVWEVDLMCIDFLQVHPAVLYGQDFFNAVAPPTDNRGFDAYVKWAVEQGFTLPKVSAQLGLVAAERNRVTNAVARLRGERKVHHRSKLSMETVAAIKRDLADGLSTRKTALKHGVPLGTLIDISTGRTWWDVQPAERAA